MVFEQGTLSRKIIQFAIALLVLLSIWYIISFDMAVIFGLALNSADLNEARELISGSN